MTTQVSVGSANVSSMWSAGTPNKKIAAVCLRYVPFTAALLLHLMMSYGESYVENGLDRGSSTLESWACVKFWARLKAFGKSSDWIWRIWTKLREQNRAAELLIFGLPIETEAGWRGAGGCAPGSRAQAHPPAGGHHAYARPCPAFRKEASMVAS